MLTPKAVELLLRVKESILAHPEHLNMDIYLDGPNDSGQEDAQGLLAGQCGTSACIAGWAVALSTPSTLVNAWSVPRKATELLDLKNFPTALFMADEWPQPFRADFACAQENEDELDTLDRLHLLAQIAAARIDAFITEHTTPTTAPAQEGKAL